MCKISFFAIDAWLNFYTFLISPSENKDDKACTKNKIAQLISIFFLNLMVVIVLIFLISIVESTGAYNTEKHKITDLLNESPRLALFSAVIIAPLIEELIFRTYLVKKYSPIKILSILTDFFKLKDKDLAYNILSNYWKKYYKYIIYFSAFIFGFVHITNYDINTNLLLFSPLVISPQIYIGLCLAYLRVKFGLIWAIAYHSFYNFILMVPVVLFFS